MSSFADRFGNLTVEQAQELNLAAAAIDTIRALEKEKHP